MPLPPATPNAALARDSQPAQGISRRRALARTIGALAFAPTLTLVAGCGDPSRRAAGGSGGDLPTRLVLADRESGDGFHPATGYAQTGVSPVYDGLLALVPSGRSDAMPTFTPALAADMPTHDRDARTWTVKLREGVTFSDGSHLTSRDVKISYDIARKPETGSQVVERYRLISSIDTPDDHTVVFHLAHPMAEFLSRLTYAIAPAALLEASPSITKNSLNAKPVGTGPYVLAETRADEQRFTAHAQHWRGKPAVEEIVVTLIEDETARAQRVAAGEIDGATVPPSLASGLKKKGEVHLDAVTSADWRGISFPGLPEFDDPRVRRALNLAVDRAAFISGPMSGYGTPLETLISPYYGDAHDPKATFGHDVAAAEKLLDEAGWRRGADGRRAKDGTTFEVPLLYAGADSLRRDIAIEFASQMKKLGLTFTLRAGTWDAITPQLTKACAVLGGGSAPYDVSVMVYEYFHTRTATTGPYANPGNHGSPEMDRALDEARSEHDPARRAALYRKIQAAYIENPSALCLATVQHLYVSRPNAWKKPPLLVEPHIHGVTWGPWWNVGSWKK